MLHSGSRGVGNAIGTHFIELAKKDACAAAAQPAGPGPGLLRGGGASTFGDYVRAVGWAQRFAAQNRELMMARLIARVRQVIAKPFETHVEAVNCHHNYVQQERHFGEDVFVTRKGAVSARAGSWASSRAAWARAASSCAGSATRTASTAAATAPAA
jgi:tRNA-splicing ligase RtcB